MRTGTTLSHLLSDHLGSSSVTTDANGAKTASALYKAFGETRYTLGNLGTDYRFTGQREEASLGIYFFQARWYDGSLGRFLSPDSLVPASTQGTQAWDRYAFVNNNPVRYNDPTGHFVNILIGVAIGAVVGGAIAAAYSYSQTGSVNWNMVGAGALAGGIAGGIIATGVGLLAAPTLTTTGLATAGAELAGAAETANIACGGDMCASEIEAVGTAGGDILQTISNVNPTGGTLNCLNCAVATDATLAGSPASALPGGPSLPSVLSQTYGTEAVEQALSSPTSIGAIENQLTNAGNGARGIVMAYGNGSIGHAFNAINNNGVVQFVDGQTGTFANTSCYTTFYFLCTAGQ